MNGPPSCVARARLQPRIVYSRASLLCETQQRQDALGNGAPGPRMSRDDFSRLVSSGCSWEYVREVPFGPKRPTCTGPTKQQPWRTEGPTLRDTRRSALSRHAIRACNQAPRASAVLVETPAVTVSSKEATCRRPFPSCWLDERLNCLMSSRLLVHWSSMALSSFAAVANTWRWAREAVAELHISSHTVGECAFARNVRCS